MLRTPKAQSKPPEPRKSPLRQFWDKAKDGERLDLSSQLNFAVKGEKEVQELREQLKELRDLIDRERERARNTGNQPAPWINRGINFKTDMKMPAWEHEKHSKDPRSWIREFETYIKLLNGGGRYRSPGGD